ncbi:MAG: prolipoprotein diacylglyceryl transferase [Candidatus Cloacimonetes bacterium HGW-Cloacimonetes-2]|jgi:phosphatidylglycerol:prolipoprotein diacylglycerol transferase|nr:MAG: prolipoprotein diacylglyceryl transferase [Candidatus Cloacimonetes bacterium HGW-Cloacimonetes-2]
MIPAVLNFPNLRPEIVSFNLLGMQMQVRWYGFFYVLSFVLGYFLYKYNLGKRNIKLSREQYESALFTIMLGVIIGGRLGYVLFYNLIYYIQNPLYIFAVWEGGMSFHGGALGVIIGGLIFCKRQKLSFYSMADPAVPLVAVGLGLGRLGNFINGELYGKITSLPWGMIFPGSDGKPRHPSQIYELLLEGVVLALITQYLLGKVKREGIVFWTFIGGYGFFRFLIEFVREPDSLEFYNKFGMIFGFMSIGQFLSLLMVLVSAYGIWKLNMKALEKK